MHLQQRCIRMSLLLLLCLLNIGFGLYAGAPLLVGSGAIGACYVALVTAQAAKAGAAA
ncbi:MAG: hypothetical protein ABSG86_17330 [Thermoguttaceae bacterium]